ncbi:putative glycerol-3-phosphate acyltransferase 2 [Sesamum alatum]|uniref:Glycerol-3-phosphate acyltransferase 2 n=1 Tax=Sesamum alatum TaxID=300844 RepID=A0AAE2CAK8_9LAMI|nr:putative glycerol-3-phosphate acyltransferase 2 [Sesamum alatum]
MFMWLPMGFTLCFIRAIIVTLPVEIKFPILHLTGANIGISNPELATTNQANGALYACNHRTMLDTVVLSYCLRTHLTAVAYSLSRVSEILAPVKLARLTSNREQDAALRHKLLSQVNLVVYPEGTTCREPYLLRLSPLFTEMSDNIFPVAIACHASIFYGTTARGLKSLDPLFFGPFPEHGTWWRRPLNLLGDRVCISSSRNVLVPKWLSCQLCTWAGDKPSGLSFGHSCLVDFFEGPRPEG